jgi:hypothetical protein
MAVTIQESPSANVLSDSPITWTFISNQTAQPNFSYLITTYINDVEVDNNTVFPERGAYAKFDASELASIYANVLQPKGGLIAYDSQNYVTVKIKITERYGDPITNQANITTSNVLAIKGKDFKENYYTSLVGKMLANNTIQPMTYQPRFEVRLGQDNFYTFINNGYDINIAIQLWNESGDIEADAINITSNTWKVITLNMNSSLWIASTGLTLSDFELATYWEVTIINQSGGGQLAKTFTIYKEDKCTYKTRQTLYFNNRIGGIDMFNFNLISRRSNEIESHGMQRRFGYWADDNIFQYDDNSGTQLDIEKIASRGMKILSDWIDEDILEWLNADLISNPCTYLYLVGKEFPFMRVKMLNKKTEDKIDENDELFNLEVEILTDIHKSFRA